MNKLYVVAFRFIASVVNFGMPLLVVNIFGASLTSEFVVFSSLVVMLGVVFNLGTNQLALKYISRGLNGETLFRFQLTIVKIFCFVFLFLFLLNILFFLFGYDFWFLSFSIFLQALTLYVASLYQAKGNDFKSIAFQVFLVPFFVIVISSLKYFNLNYGGSLIEIYVALQFSFLIYALVDVLCTLRKAQVGNENSVEFTPFLQNIFVVVLMTQFVQLGSQFYSTFMLPELLSAEFILYQKVSMAVSFLQMSLNILYLRQFSILYNEKALEALRKCYQKSVFLGVLTSLPVVMLLLFEYENLLVYLGFSNTNVVGFFCLIAAQFLIVLAGPAGYLLTLTEFEGAFRRVVLFSGSFSLCFTPVFIYFFGFLGACLGVLVAIFIHTFLTAFMVKRKLGFLGFFNPKAMF